MKNKKKYRNILIHISVWIAYLLLQFLLFDNFAYRFNPYFHILFTSSLAIVFYINYFVLIPGFLFRKRFRSYIILSLLMMVILGSIIVKGKEITESDFRHRIEQHHDDLHFKSDRHQTDGDHFKHQKPPFKYNLGFLYMLLMFYSISLAIRLFQQWTQNEKLKQEEEKEKFRAELSYLKHQINPHFLFNSLNSIYALSYKKSDLTTDYILKLSDILRYMLYDTGRPQVRLAEELEVIEKYLSVQKLRITENTKVIYSTGGSAGEYHIEPLLILPLVENAFKYGTDNLNPSEIEIRITIENGVLTVTTRNTIVKNNDRGEKREGIGLKNLVRRLELIYPEKHTFEAKPDSGVFYTSLQIWLKSLDA